MTARFQIVHTEARFEIVHTEGVKQPWHGRYRAANGEIVWWTELYADKRDALRAISLLAPLDYDHNDTATAFANFHTHRIPVVEIEQGD